MTLALDASTPASVTIGQNVSSVATAAFSPPANSVLFAVVMVDLFNTGSSQANRTASITNSGTALTWTLLGRDNTMQYGDAEVWWAANSAAQSGITVTATLGASTYNISGGTGMFRVLVMNGAASTQSGAVTTRNSTAVGATPSLSVTTTAANSWVWAAFVNVDNG